MTRATLAVGWKSIPGARHRDEGRPNEDAVVVATDHPVIDALLLVADGLGGHPLPDTAARTAAAAARSALEKIGRPEHPDTTRRTVRDAVLSAHRHVQALAPAADNGKPPGTTLTAAVVAAGVLHVAHVGDGSVFVARGGSVRRLAGGEGRRSGSRPESYLGSREPLEVDEASLALATGDRVLICTDGLTRYFAGEAGEQRMAAILARPEAHADAVAGQLTAHSRGESYDDDTSVVVAEVTDLRDVPDPRPAATRRAQLPASGQGGRVVATCVAALLGAALVAVGYLAGRASLPASPGRGAATRESPLTPAPPQALAQLGRRNLVLLDEAGRTLYVLRTAPVAIASAGTRPLLAFHVSPRGKIEYGPTGFRLDGARRQLIMPDGARYPLSVDPELGVMQILPGAQLKITSQPPGLRCTIDGREIGATPRDEKVAAGRHVVRVHGRSGVSERSIEVPAGATLTLPFGAVR